MTGPWLHWIGGGLIALAGLTLLAWALLWDRSRGRRRCPGTRLRGCWYDMRGSTSLQCPECGRVARRERQLSRTRRRWRWAFVGLLVLCFGAGLGVKPSLSGGRWQKWVPSTAIIIMLPWVDQPWPVQELRVRTWGNYYGSATWIREDALWDWQWRLLVNRGAAMMDSDISSAHKTKAQWLILGCAPDPNPATDALIRCLDDPDPSLREMTAWGIKAARHDFNATNRAKLIAALNGIEGDPDPKAREAVGWTIPTLERLSAWDRPAIGSRPFSPEASPTPSPEEIIARLDGAKVDALIEVYRDLGGSSRWFTWPFVDESGPYHVVRHDLEIDGDPGDDCVIQIAEPGQHYWQMFILLRRGDGWEFAGYLNSTSDKVTPPRVSSVAAPDGETWLVVRAMTGWSSDRTYLHVCDSWLSFRGGEMASVLMSPRVEGCWRDKTYAQSTPVNMTVSSPPPTVGSDEHGTYIQYDVTVDYAAGWNESWDVLPPEETALAKEAGELFTKRGTLRYRWRPWAREFEPIVEPGLWTKADLDNLLGTTDEFLERNVNELVALARSDTPEVRAWLRLFLSQCADSPAKRALEAEAHAE